MCVRSRWSGTSRGNSQGLGMAILLALVLANSDPKLIVALALSIIRWSFINRGV